MYWRIEFQSVDTPLEEEVWTDVSDNGTKNQYLVRFPLSMCTPYIQVCFQTWQKLLLLYLSESELTAKLADAPFQRGPTKYGLIILPTKKTKISLYVFNLNRKR